MKTKAKPRRKRARTTDMPATPDPQWEARNALDTISRAEEHKRNAPLMKHVKRLALQQAAAVHTTTTETKKRGKR